MNKKSLVKGNKNGKNKKAVVIVAIILFSLVALSILAWIFLPKILANEEKPEDESMVVREKLEQCMSEAEKYVNNAKKYEEEIKCYEENHVDDSETRIAHLNNLKDEAELDDCILIAQAEYSVTQEEIDRALKSGVSAQNKLISKMVNGYNAQITCYEKYPNAYGGTSKEKISELEKDKKELQKATSDLNDAYSDYIGSSSGTNESGSASGQSSGLSQETSCKDYYSKYNSEYESAVNFITSKYNQQLEDASSSCAGSGQSFSGCYGLKERQIKNQRDVEIQQKKNEFKQKLTSVGCGNYYDK